MEKNDADAGTPTLMDKIKSSANWGMLAGFWIELPLLVYFRCKAGFSKAKLPLDSHKLTDWTVKLVLPSTLVGAIYGWLQPNREEARLEGKIARIEDAMGEGNKKSWAAAERAKSESATQVAR